MARIVIPDDNPPQMKGTLIADGQSIPIDEEVKHKAFSGVYFPPWEEGSYGGPECGHFPLEWTYVDIIPLSGGTGSWSVDVSIRIDYIPPR